MQMQDICDIYNEGWGKGKLAEPRDFARRLRGTNTDHAADQKKLVNCLNEWWRRSDREERGKNALCNMPSQSTFFLLIECTEKVIAAVGSVQAWDALPPGEKEMRHKVNHAALYQRIGEEEFQKFLEEEKASIDLFLWVGCCMHKELNTFKGGCKGLGEYWISKGIQGPVKLMNKDNNAAAELGNEETKQHAEENSTGGAVKLATLAGSLWRHKDKKKGQQDSYKNFMEEKLNYIVNFPDTSNT